MTWSYGSCTGKDFKQYKNEKNPKTGKPIVYQKVCSQPEGTYPVFCEDFYGDGWHGGYLEIDGKKYCEEFKSKYGRMEVIGKENLHYIIRKLFQVLFVANLNRRIYC